jgi:hypothetical protein
MSARRRKLAEAVAAVPAVLADAPGALPPGCLVRAARATSTDMAVIVLAAPARPPAAFLKVPLTPAATRGLERESLALTALHGEPRLGEWRALVPRTLAAGTAGGRPYRIDAALSGRPAVTPSAALRDGAAETIHVLHRATAAEVSGAELAPRWVDAPLHELARHGAPRGRAAEDVRRLRDELHEALAGRRLAAGWIHGDYWVGNLLLADRQTRPSGIADWEAAGTPELPLHDILHLLLSGRRLATGAQLGALVRHHLSRGWTAPERRWLERHATDGALSLRHALLLYWLRQVSVHARQQGRIGGMRYRAWEQRNVRGVLAAL